MNTLPLTADSIAASEKPRADLKSIEQKVVCQCGCNMPLNTCTCSFSKQMRAKIQRRIDQGENEDAILAGLIQKYGPTVLSTPPTRGFFLSAWILPFVALIIGATFIALYLKKKPATPKPSKSKNKPLPAIKTDDLDRLLREIDQ